MSVFETHAILSTRDAGHGNFVNMTAESEDEIEVSICASEESPEWEDFVQHFPRATFCHAYHWRSIIQGAYGHRPIYLMAKGRGRVRGILPLFLVRSRIFGRSLTSMPFLDYGGACADSPEATRMLLTQAVGLLRGVGADYLEIRQCDPLAENAAPRLDKVSMILDLSPGIEGLWQSLPAKVRNQVRKADKANLEVTFGGAELLDEFYPVFAVNMRDLGSPVHHLDFFTELHKGFGPQARSAIIRDGNRPVGGLMALFFKDTVIVPWASSLREYFPKCPNNLLYWETIKFASMRGCKRFDFGRSSLDSGTFHFKRQWGAEPAQIYWQTLTSTGEVLTRSVADDSKYHFALEIWKRLPVAVTTFIGPCVRKYITN
jgi:serine/alanine adding enzyme